MITRSPTTACVIEQPALIVHSRPIQTSGPIAALAPITVLVPISARGPITAPGSMIAPLSTLAEEWTNAPAATPSASNNEDGRKESGNNDRATATKAL